MKKILAMSVICALAVAVAAPAASAQEPTREGYSETGQDGESLGAIEGLPPSDGSGGSNPETEGSNPESGGSNPENEEAATEEAATESLPFTGLDVGIVALLGAALLGTGIAVRRVARSSQP
jgi:hypothetical protein